MFQRSLIVGLVLVAFLVFLLPRSFARPASEEPRTPDAPHSSATQESGKLPVPPEGKIAVAFVIGQDAEVLDSCGPFEVFSGAYTQEGKPIFAPYLVAATLDPVTVGGGMKVVPDHTFQSAPRPRVIVIPAMSPSAATPEMIQWIREASKSTDVTMSVCNGSFVLAKTGLLSGKQATAHHGGYFRFAGMFPDVQLKRGARFVEAGNLATSGGISAGIDLALRVVERYAGRELADQVADGMEYQGKGWLDPNSNAEYAALPNFDETKPVCPLCLMKVDHSLRTEHKGKIYYFCSPD